MRQWPAFLYITGAIVTVTVALIISGLRLAIPQLDHYRVSLLNRISSVSGVSVAARALHGSWEKAGPALEITDLNVGLKEGDRVKVARVTLTLDIWQSLIHARWQFRDLTLRQMQFSTNTPLLEKKQQPFSFRADTITRLFFQQVDHFNLYDSTISFLTPSGERTELTISRLAWLNEKKRHRAEGEVSLSSLTGQHGVMQVRLDLNDSNGLLGDGRIWMQAEEIDLKPWLSQGIPKDNSLESANFSLAVWLNLKKGQVDSGDILLKKGRASWQKEKEPLHQLTVRHLTAHLAQVENGWSMNVPRTSLETDGKSWPEGQLSLLWQEKGKGLFSSEEPAGELRIRATKLELACFEPLLPLFTTLSPQLSAHWRKLQPRGHVDLLAVDLPMGTLKQSRFQVKWHNMSWQPWQQLPGIRHLSGTASGSIAAGNLNVAMQNVILPRGNMFRAPLEIKQMNGALNWRYNDQGLELSGQNIDLQARSLWTKGDFRYLKPAGQPPRLDVLAGIQLADAAEGWRYFPEPLMGTSLIDYLSGAIKGGTVKDATLIFSGDPHRFPFRQNDGLFQVSVPLRNAQYQFESGWPALEKQDIDLNFINDSLSMNAPHMLLGKVKGKNITAVIPAYRQHKLTIEGELEGSGAEVRHYFKQSPLATSLGSALDQLQVSGNVSGNVHLVIPLKRHSVHASGDVVLKDNHLLINPLNTTLTRLAGRFRYDNGTLHSDQLTALWFGQPVSIWFNTAESKKNYQIGVKLQGNWQPTQIKTLPTAIGSRISGRVDWQSDAIISLPTGGGVNWQTEIEGNLDSVSSRLPPPLGKKTGSPLPFKVTAQGNQHMFYLGASLGRQLRFNSHWLTKHHLQLERGILASNGQSIPLLPDDAAVILNLPALNGDVWGKLLAGGRNKTPVGPYLPDKIRINTPALTLAGQQWHDLSVTLNQTLHNSRQIQTQGREIDGILTLSDNSLWRAQFNYLYYNPQFTEISRNLSGTLSESHNASDFSHWPALDIRCHQCWFRGQNLGHIQGVLMPKHDRVLLKEGLIDNGNAQLTLTGEWQSRAHEQRTSLKGEISGKNISDTANWFGAISPLQQAPFDFSFDVNWRSLPWQPSVESLSGVLKGHLGKGEIASVDTGWAGQLLKLISFDALLRKLRLDFRDTLHRGFYFDSINGTAQIENGVLKTHHLLADGLEADIAVQGSLDLVKREINMEAVVAPEISATVGVAAAFAVNPVVGAAVFAATKALSPLWNKISLLRYHFSGPFDKPVIKETLRKPRDVNAK